LLILVLVIGGVIGFAIKKAPEEPKATPTPIPTPVTIPNDPSNLVATVITSGRIDLSWHDNSDNEAGFKIERKPGIEGSYRQIAIVRANLTTYSDRGVVENTTYYYQVRAYNAVGHSSYSNEAIATTLPPTYHIMGGTAVGSKKSVSVAAMTKTNRYYVYQGWNPQTNKFQAPLGSAFVVVAVSTTNLSNAPLVVRRADFALRDAAYRDTYGLFNYTWGDVGDPFPEEIVLGPSRTVAGVILYQVPETAPVSGMNPVYSLDGTLHIWKP
jgi:hypothetical protein